MRKKNWVRGDKVVRSGGRKVIIRILKEPLLFCGESTPTLFSSALVYLRLNWKLSLPTEINENSYHPLSVAFKLLGLLSFSILENSILMEVSAEKDSLKMAEKVAQFLFKCEKNQVLHEFIYLEGPFEFFRSLVLSPSFKKEGP